MREILFKGKSEYGKWVEGDLIQYESGEVAILNRFSEYGHEASEIYYRTKVIPETVSQFTGLYDSTKWEELTEEEREMFVRKEGNPSEWKGKRIFEGEVVKVTDDEGVISHCNCGVGKVCFLEGIWYIDGDVQNGLYDINRCYYIEVIGNIHDTEGGK